MDGGKEERNCEVELNSELGRGLRRAQGSTQILANTLLATFSPANRPSATLAVTVTGAFLQNIYFFRCCCGLHEA